MFTPDCSFIPLAITLIMVLVDSRGHILQTLLVDSNDHMLQTYKPSNKIMFANKTFANRTYAFNDKLNKNLKGKHDVYNEMICIEFYIQIPQII